MLDVDLTKILEFYIDSLSSPNYFGQDNDFLPLILEPLTFFFEDLMDTFLLEACELHFSNRLVLKLNKATI